MGAGSGARVLICCLLGGRGRGGVCSFVACFRDLAIDHAAFRDEAPLVEGGGIGTRTVFQVELCSRWSNS